jgi:hypothetical protein
MQMHPSHATNVVANTQVDYYLCFMRRAVGVPLQEQAPVAALDAAVTLAPPAV